jgi:hypothetical protein
LQWKARNAAQRNEDLQRKARAAGNAIGENQETRIKTKFNLPLVILNDAEESSAIKKSFC